MTDLTERLAASDYLSAPGAAAELRAALQRELDPDLLRLLRGAPRIVLVGSGGSYASLLTAGLLLEQLTTKPVDVIPGKDLVWRRPAWLGPQTPVIFISWSGGTTDVVEALRVAQEVGAPTVGITGKPGTTLDTDCTFSLVYDGVAIYEVPIALILRLFADSGELLTALPEVADVLERDAEVMIERMRVAADGIAAAEHVYVTGAGPMSSLAFKLAPVFMENVRIGASFFDASEMRHGSIEFLERHRPTLVALLGTDASRETTAMVINFVRDRGGDVVVLDAADLAPVHPLLTGLVINSWTQWLVAWSAVARGIEDLDERVFMGKGLLSKGQWP